MKRKAFLIYLISLVFFSACQKEEAYVGISNPLKDIDGNQYKTVTIGNQTWMGENLRTTRYNDGTPIPNVTDDDEWIELNTPAYCWYLNWEAEYKLVYGAYYNGYVIETEKVCPTGWHVPTLQEWKTLYNTVEDDRFLHNPKVGEALKSIGGWENGCNGVDEYRFSAIGSGLREPNGKFVYRGTHTYFWSSSTCNRCCSGYFTPLFYCNRDIELDWPFGLYLGTGSVIRCIKD